MTENSPPTNDVTKQQRRSYVDPAAMMRIKNLELRAKVVMEGFQAGLHRSPYHGFSVEFTDYRQYSPGDDLRHLDWKLLARQDRKYIKRFEDETNLRCHLLVDLSRSMSYQSKRAVATKAEYAKTIAATLSLFLSMQRDAVGIFTFDETITDYLPPRFRPGHLRRLMMCLERSEGGKSTNLRRPLEQIASTVTKRSLIVLVSDLLAEPDQVTQQLGVLRSMGHDLMVLRILDPAEIDFEFEAASMFRDNESGREIYVDPQTVASDYRQRFESHDAELRKACSELGVDYVWMKTNEPIDSALFGLIQTRARGGRIVARGKYAGGTA